MAMEVQIKIEKAFELKNKGVTLHIHDSTGKLGRLCISKATVEWIPEGKWKGNGHKFKMSHFCEYLNKAGGGKMALKPR